MKLKLHSDLPSSQQQPVDFQSWKMIANSKHKYGFLELIVGYSVCVHYLELYTESIKHKILYIQSEHQTIKRRLSTYLVRIIYV